MNYRYAFENRNISRIDKLNQLTDPVTFWDDVRKLTRRTTSDPAIRLWQRLAELRYSELIEQEASA